MRPLARTGVENRLGRVRMEGGASHARDRADDEAVYTRCLLRRRVKLPARLQNRHAADSIAELLRARVEGVCGIAAGIRCPRPCSRRRSARHRCKSSSHAWWARASFTRKRQVRPEEVMTSIAAPLPGDSCTVVVAERVRYPRGTAPGPRYQTMRCGNKAIHFRFQRHASSLLSMGCFSTHCERMGRLEWM